MNQSFNETAPSLPDGFYIGLSSSPIDLGKLTVVVTFENNTDAVVSVTWASSHLYKVTVTAIDGVSLDLETLLPAPLPDQPATDVDPRTQHRMVYPVDTTKAPYAAVFAFDKAKSPYTLKLALNSPSHPYVLRATVPVLRAAPTPVPAPSPPPTHT